MHQCMWKILIQLGDLIPGMVSWHAAKTEWPELMKEKLCGYPFRAKICYKYFFQFIFYVVLLLETIFSNNIIVAESVLLTIFFV